MTEEKTEEETYSLIYTSLKHPIRRRILRMIAQKPLSYSEILETLTVDSGHLSYHLESLGELIVHTKDGKYMLSSFGFAALRLMSGVEELPPQSSTQKHRIAEYIPKVFSLLLAISLVVASIHFVTYIAPVSTSTLNQDDIFPTPFTVNASQTFEFNITVEYYTQNFIPIGHPIWSRAIYLGPYGPDAYTFEVEPAPDSVTAQARGVMWLDFRLNTTSASDPTGNFWLSYTPPRPPNDIEVDVYMPTETKSLGKLDWTYGDIDHFTSPTVEVNQLGTYRFVIKNSGSSVWTGLLTPNLQWQIIEKPYFNYGIIGFVISAVYIALFSYNVLKSKNKNHSG